MLMDSMRNESVVRSELESDEETEDLGRDVETVSAPAGEPAWSFDIRVLNDKASQLDV